MLKRLLTIIVLCLFTFHSFSQTEKQVDEFYRASKHKDQGLKYYLKFLSNGPATDTFFFEGFRNEACENIASIYESKKQYSKAIAYYDSADTKYYNGFEHCGNGVFFSQLRRKWKISKCYMAMNDSQNALSVLTPFMFDPLAFRLDSFYVNYYIDVMSLLYSKEQAKKELADGIENMNFSRYLEPGPDSSTKYLTVSCKLYVFGTEIEQAGSSFYIKSAQDEKETLAWVTKEYYIKYIKEQLTIYQKIQEL
jgi:tetratricopeptide (TPR) repeat protein